MNKIELKRAIYFPQGLEHVVRDGQSYMDQLPDRREMWLTDYTGLWKIINVNEVAELYIQCFEVYEDDVPIMKKVMRDVRTKEYKGFWNTITGGTWVTTSQEIEEVQSTEKRVRASVQWVHENDLDLTIETINECSCEVDK